MSETSVSKMSNKTPKTENSTEGSKSSADSPPPRTTAKRSTLTPERLRLASIPCRVFFGIVGELLMNVAYHIVTVIVLVDLSTIQNKHTNTIMLNARRYGERRAHFWALFSSSITLHMNTMTVLLWPILPYGIAKGDASWVNAWTLLKKILIFLMLLPTLAIAFGGESHFSDIYFICFFFYFVLTVIIFEVMARYSPYVKLPFVDL